MGTKLLNRILTEEEEFWVKDAFINDESYEDGTLGRLIYDMSQSTFDDGVEKSYNDGYEKGIEYGKKPLEAKQ